ncbi:MAG TPA: hypothetical protein VMJ31_01600 [Methylocystis sp.]|nr:hypothetical protein [Methylocystis sp.]
MKSVLAFVGLACLGIAPQGAEAAAKGQKTITCPLPGGENLTFVKPARLGDLPKIELDYPSKVTLFSFRDGNFLTVAVDESDPSRVRLVISAQFNKTKGAYDGQLVIDSGGNELQLENGPVSCKSES